MLRRNAVVILSLVCFIIICCSVIRLDRPTTTAVECGDDCQLPEVDLDATLTSKLARLLPVKISEARLKHGPTTSKGGPVTHSSVSKTIQAGTKSNSKGGPVTQPTKPLILLYHKLHGSTNWWFTTTDKDFAHCVHKCQVTSDRSLYSSADMVMFECPREIISQKGETIRLRYFQDDGQWPTKRGNSRQVRMFFAREPQTGGLSGDDLSFATSMFNYTMTFQQSSDIFYPYGHAQKLQSAIRVPNYGAAKTRLVLWIVSNCASRRRMNYKLELEKYVQVDMIGRCNKTHGDPCKRDYTCLAKLKHQYKFYLAFENTLCQEYITEKFWKALNEQMVPVVMGTSRQIYESVAPPNSFIHVNDFASPRLLADYLKLLDKNMTLYNEYHKWRQSYGIRWNSANCDMCRLATKKPQKVTNISQAWNSRTQCVL